MRLLFVFACFLTFELGITLSEVMSQQKSSLETKDLEFLASPEAISIIKRLREGGSNLITDEVELVNEALATASRWQEIKSKLDRDLILLKKMTSQTNESIQKQKSAEEALLKAQENAQIELQLSRLKLSMSSFLLVAALVLAFWYLYLAFLKFKPHWFVVRKMHRMLEGHGTESHRQ